MNQKIFFYVYSIIIALIMGLLLQSPSDYSDSDTIFAIITVSSLLTIPYVIILDHEINLFGNLIDYYTKDVKFNKIITTSLTKYTLQIFLCINIIINIYSLLISEYGVLNQFVIIGTLVLITTLILYTYAINYLFMNKYASIISSIILVIMFSTILEYLVSLITKTAIYSNIEQMLSENYIEFGPLTIISITFVIIIISLIVLIDIDKPSRKKEYRLKFLEVLLLSDMSTGAGIELNALSEEIDKSKIISQELREKIKQLHFNNDIVEIDGTDIHKADLLLRNNEQNNVFTNIFMFKYHLYANPNITTQQINNCISFKNDNVEYKIKADYPKTRYFEMSIDDKNINIFKLASELNFKQYVLFINDEDYNEALIDKLNEVTKNRLKVIKINW